MVIRHHLPNQGVVRRDVPLAWGGRCVDFLLVPPFGSQDSKQILLSGSSKPIGRRRADFLSDAHIVALSSRTESHNPGDLHWLSVNRCLNKLDKRQLRP